MGLDDNVYFLGMQKNVADYYQAMDCFLLPSRFEGLGIVGIEAQASSLCCIVSTNVSRELQITELVKYISLNENIDIWVKEILKSKLNKRINRYKEIVNKGYDIEEGNKIFQEYFISLLNKKEG